MPIVTVITVTYNSSETIKACLDSVINQSFKDLEHIVVDNASEDDTTRIVKSKYPHIKLIKNKRNVGFSKANNEAILASEGKYVLTLNPDAALERDFIRQIMEFLEKVPGANRIGMISGKILREDGVTIDSAGLILTRFRRFYDRGSGEIDNGKYNKAEKIFGACAAAAFYRKDMLEDLRRDCEYFDEDFFCFVEDVDLAWRANKKGWSCCYVPEAKCRHARNSRRYKKSFRQYYAFRNRLLMNIKNDRFNLYTIPGILFYDIPRALFMLAINPSAIKVFTELIYYAPRMIRKRNKLHA